MRITGPQNGDLETAAMQRLIELRLKARLRQETLAHVDDLHPDEDLINAFVEGRLEDDESGSLIAHLVSCAYCLHLTSQLVRLESEMDEVGSSTVPAADEGPLQRFLDRIAAGVMPSAEDDAVFAYEDKSQPGDKAKTDQEPPDHDPGSSADE